MLRHLAIRDFAIISEVQFDVAPGFTAITGETGAGKSILVDALGLLLGDRADAGLIAEGKAQAELEAVFHIEEHAPARRWLADQALEENEQLILRRVLTRPSGSRAWINGRSATVGQLAELGSLLVEIHGQHEHQQLEKPAVQRQLLDGLVDDGLRRRVEERHAAWCEAREALDALEAAAGNAEQLELLRFQARELAELDLGEGEFESLENEQERLARSDELQLAVARAAAALDSEEGAAARSLVHQAIQALEPLREIESELDETSTMLEEARINIDEALVVLERLGNTDAGDPERLDAVNRRLERSLDLARKHRVQPAELPTLTQELSERLDALEHQGERREELAARVDEAAASWLEAARTLSKARKKAGRELSDRVGECLAELGMDAARLQFAIESDEAAAPSRQGLDRVTIEFSANPGQPPQPLARVASGGELSRVALALMIAGDHRAGPGTRIFDEVDAGVGGETAHAVGRFLRSAADGGQAMCVTHLAQVAACADHQLRVSKTKARNETRLSIEALDADSRQREVARMLGNAESEKSLAHAAELLGK